MEVHAVLGWAWTGTPLLNYWLPTKGDETQHHHHEALPRKLSVAKLGDVAVALLSVSQKPQTAMMEIGGSAAHQLRVALSHTDQVVVGVLFSIPRQGTASEALKAAISSVAAADENMDTLRPSGATILPHPPITTTPLMIAVTVAHCIANRGLVVVDSVDGSLNATNNSEDGSKKGAKPMPISKLLRPILTKDAALRDESNFTSGNIIRDREETDGSLATANYRTVPQSCEPLRSSAFINFLQTTVEGWSGVANHVASVSPGQCLLDSRVALLRKQSQAADGSGDEKQALKVSWLKHHVGDGLTGPKHTHSARNVDMLALDSILGAVSTVLSSVDHHIIIGDGDVGQPNCFLAPADTASPAAFMLPIHQYPLQDHSDAIGTVLALPIHHGGQLDIAERDAAAVVVMTILQLPTDSCPLPLCLGGASAEHNTDTNEFAKKSFGPWIPVEDDANIAKNIAKSGALPSPVVTVLSNAAFPSLAAVKDCILSPTMAPLVYGRSSGSTSGGAANPLLGG